MKLAVTYAAQTFDLRGKVMGRQAAGAGFLHGLSVSGLDEVGCFAASEQLAMVFADDLSQLSFQSPLVRYVPFAQPEKLTSFDLLYRADPSLGDDAWYRQQRSGARAYSLCGVTHTLCSKGAMGALSDLPDLPLYPWDAVICTSRVARDVALRLVEARVEHIRRRFGAMSAPLPQLPLIPLGVHADDFVASGATRAAARATLGLAPDEIAVLFAGRLTFHAKAHPMPMLLGLERAAATGHAPVALMLFGQFANDAIAATFRAEAARFAPSVRLVVVDGAEPANGPRAWAAADIFTSLSDNIQETFGLTPIEAMAAGLPCVVSDWNGYKDTVRDGVDGFRVPVTAPPPEAGGDLADRFDVGVSSYDHYIGEASLFTAVDITAAAEAYGRLIASPDLRRTMGEAGRVRARALFDWSVIMRRYLSLWEELNERRRSDPTVPGEEARTRRPDRADPFTLFRSHPTDHFSAETRVRLALGMDAAEVVLRRRLGSVDYAGSVLPSEALVTRFVTVLRGREHDVTLADLREALAPMSLLGVIRTVAFLAKMGVLEVARRSGA